MVGCFAPENINNHRKSHHQLGLPYKFDSNKATEVIRTFKENSSQSLSKKIELKILTIQKLKLMIY